MFVLILTALIILCAVGCKYIVVGMDDEQTADSIYYMMRYPETSTICRPKEEFRRELRLHGRRQIRFGRNVVLCAVLAAVAALLQSCTSPPVAYELSYQTDEVTTLEVEDHALLDAALGSCPEGRGVTFETYARFESGLPLELVQSGYGSKAEGLIDDTSYDWMPRVNVVRFMCGGRLEAFPAEFIGRTASEIGVGVNAWPIGHRDGVIESGDRLVFLVPARS